VFSPALEIVLTIALREAVSRQHAYLTLEHLLYALAHDPDGERILVACGADLPALRRALGTYLDESIERQRRGTARNPEQTMAFRRVLQTAILHIQSAQRDEANAGVTWERTFSLLPNTSITFSGTATLASDQPTTQQATFAASPNLNPQYANRGSLSFHSSLGDGSGWINGISFIARIMNFDPRLPAGSPSLGREGSVDDFAYSSDEQGHLSLTLFNHSDELMFTSLSLSAFAVAPFISPIPEPSTAAAMLLGLGLLAWRRKAFGPSSTPTAAGGLA